MYLMGRNSIAAGQPGYLDHHAPPGRPGQGDRGRGAGPGRNRGRRTGRRGVRWWRRLQYRSGGAATLRSPAEAGGSRPARLRDPQRPARFPDRDEVRRRAHRERHRRAARHRPLHGRRQAVPGRLLRDQVGSGVPSPRARHVRAAGLSRRRPLSRRPAQASLRQRRLQPRAADGGQVRPDPRRVRRTVREDRQCAGQASGQRDRGIRRRVPDRPPDQ